MCNQDLGKGLEEEGRWWVLDGANAANDVICMYVSIMVKPDNLYNKNKLKYVKTKQKTKWSIFRSTSLHFLGVVFCFSKPLSLRLPEDDKKENTGTISLKLSFCFRNSKTGIS